MSTAMTGTTNSPGETPDFLFGGAADILLDALPGAKLIFDRNLIILKQNKAHEDMTMSRRQDVVGRYLFNAFPAQPGPDSPTAETAVRESVRYVFETGETDEMPIQEHGLLVDNHIWQTRFWRITHSPIMRDGKVMAVLQTSEDVTVEMLQKSLSEARSVAAQEAAAVSYFSIDLTSGLFTRGKTVDELFGFAPDEAGLFVEPFFDRILGEDWELVEQELERIQASPLGTIAKFDYRIKIPPEDEIRHVRARGAMVVDPEDRIRKLVGVFIDMTDTEQNRARLELALQEKDNLLIEVNHRVKNSLQLVTSVLRMEARRIADPEVERILTIANSRVEAIAEVHSGLYVGNDVTRVSTRTLVNNLVVALGRSVGSGDTAADIDCRTAEFSLPTELAIAFGLLVNELLTNALKYGGTADNRPIVLETRREGKKVSLTISNDIVPAETLEHEANGTGVGTQLIQGFVRQLRAEMETSKEDGQFRVRITFNLPD